MLPQELPAVAPPAQMEVEMDAGGLRVWGFRVSRLIGVFRVWVFRVSIPSSKPESPKPQIS